MAAILRITNGIDTIDLMSAEYKAILPWSPSVATLSEDGGYTNVPETITVSLRDGELQENVNALNDLLNSTIQWRSGDNAPAVLLEYAVTGSDTVWRSTIVGPSRGPLVSLPFNFADAPQRGYINGVVLNFERRGQWLSTDRSNLAVNGDLEAWSGSPLTPDGWTIDAGASALTVSREETVVHSGTYSAHLTDVLPQRGIEQNVVVPIGTELTYSAWVYVVSGGAEIQISEPPPGYEVAVNVSTTETGKWVKLTAQRVAGIYPPPVGEVTILVTAPPGLASPAEFYVDDVRLTAVNLPGSNGDEVTADVNNGDIATLDFDTPIPKIPRPFDAVISSQLLGTNASTAYAVVSERRGNNAVSIERFLGTSFAAPWGADFTSVADSAGTLPTHGTNVLRFAPSAPLTEEQNLIGTLRRDATLSQGIPAVAVVLAKVRNNATPGGSSFVMRLQASRVDGVEWTKPVIVEPPTLAARPEVIMLGMVEGVPGTEIRLGLRATAHAAGTFDIDTIYVVYITRHTHIVRVSRGAGVKSGATGDFYLLRLTHNMMTLPGPTITAININHSGTWSGSPQVIYARKNQVDVCCIATGRESTANTWRMADTDGNVIEQTWLLSRLQGVLIPQ